MDDLRRIHYVTEHYEQLQGLRWLPLSLPFLAGALERLAGRPLLPAVVWALLVLAPLPLSSIVARYYARRFGRAQAPLWRSGALTMIGVVAGFLWFEWIREMLSLRVLLPVLFVAAALARLGVVANRLRVHYLWIAGACVGFALLPLVEPSPASRAVAADLLIGGGLAVTAIGDDRVLRRTLGGKPRDSWRTA